MDSNTPANNKNGVQPVHPPHPEAPHPETEPSHEVEKTPEVVQEPVSRDQSTGSEAKSEHKERSSEQEPRVVDKRTHHEKLHHLDDTSHKVTEKADEEEEEFIKEVEEVHSN